MSNTSIKPPLHAEGYVFGPDADMSAEAQEAAFRIRLSEHDYDALRQTDEASRYIRLGEAENGFVNLLLREPLPCAIEWCAGHTSNETFEWASLLHESYDYDIVEVDDEYENSTAIECRSRHHGLDYMRVELDIIADVSGDQVAALANTLRTMADAIELRASEYGVTA